MPNVNLSTLSGQELRRLLDSARQRGEASLSYRILQEMEARRENGGRKGLFPVRRSTEPHTVDIELGDPKARDEDDDLPPMPFWRPPAQVADAATAPEPEPEPAPEPAADPPPRLVRRGKAAPEPAATPATAPQAAWMDEEPEPPPEPEPPLSLRAPDAPPAQPDDWDLRLRARDAKAPAPPRGLRRGLAAGFAVGIAAGVSLGWWVWGSAHEALPAVAPAAATAHIAAPMQTAALAPPPAPAPTSLPATEAPPEPSPEALPDAAVEPTVSPNAPEAAGEADACAAQPTPADRAICGDPHLRDLQRELRQAYNEALEAHEDRALLRQRQLAWAAARDTVSDPDRLAGLYEERIRKLNAATAEARERQ